MIRLRPRARGSLRDWRCAAGQYRSGGGARVMLKNAPILLLDEATSALDFEVEAAIQESLNEMMESKTVIAIAHRLLIFTQLRISP